VPGQPLRLQHFAPLSMRPVDAPLKIDYSQWYTGYSNFSFADGNVVVRVPDAIEVIDGASLRVTRRYAFRHKGTCAVDSDGGTAVALTGCLTARSSAFTVWRLTPTSRRAIAVSSLRPLAWPVTFAVGDGTWFIARGDGSVDAVDLQTGRVTTHRPLRTLAKGRGYRDAVWLGDHRLGLNGTVVDVGTWRKRTLAAGAARLQAIDGYVIASGTNGITVFDDSLHLYRRLARGRVIDRVGLNDGIVYAQIGLAWDEWELRTGKHLGIVLPDTPWLVQLLS
jgi:prepilin-type processing-associated H-X9-DG protein